jgi:hypothetical protein
MARPQVTLDGHEAEPVHHSVVVFEDGRITAVGNRDDTPVPENAVDRSGRGRQIAHAPLLVLPHPTHGPGMTLIRLRPPAYDNRTVVGYIVGGGASAHSPSTLNPQPSRWAIAPAARFVAHLASLHDLPDSAGLHCKDSGRRKGPFTGLETRTYAVRPASDA